MNTSVDKPNTIPAMEVMEGGGVRVYRTIGTPALRNLDPFMMLDQMGSDDPNDYIAGFPSHPHRGFNTFTYMIDGDMEHKDSMGNTGNLGPGGAQWMKAASGVIHSEMPKQEDGLLRGFQLWINLPSANKMDDPEYQEYHSEAFPIVEQDNTRIKVIIGRLGDISSPIVDEITDVTYFDVEVKSGQYFHYTLPEEKNSFLYLFEGEGLLSNQPKEEVLESCTLVTVGGNITFQAGDEGARFLLVSGTPINEPIVQYGPFVMNTHEEVEEAMRDYQSNQLVRDCAWINRKRT